MTTSPTEHPNFSPQEDIVAVLQAQHDQVRALLIQLRADPRPDTFQWLIRLLAVHETAEQLVVYPDLAHRVTGSDEVVATRRKEESEGEALLADLEKAGVDSPDFATGVAELQHAIEQHARAEEAEVFPLLRSGLDAQRRAQLAESFRLVEAVAPTHPHPHAPDGEVGHVLVGSFAAIADRVRDALHDRD